MGWIWLVLSLVAAGWFYWLRCNHRWVYGLSEIAIGVAILSVKFTVEGPSALLVSSGSFLSGELGSLIGLFTGIYAIVRGLDNFVTGVRE